MYQLIRKILFRFDAENVHHFAMRTFSVFCCIPLMRRILKGGVASDARYSRQVFGLIFSNPVGLAAGFDKNARYLKELDALGFGFVEIGTVTPRPQTGNPRPRLFRLPKDKALVNRMGFNNEGAEAAAKRIRRFRQANRRSQLVIGGNIGKNKMTANEDAWKDYEICFNVLHDVVDFFVVNVSSPNTPGLRDLQQKDSLKKILVHLQSINESKKERRPLLLKISPDLDQRDLDDIIDLAMEIHLDGLVASNTTIRRQNLLTDPNEVEKIGAGGLSGKPLQPESTRITGYIFEKTAGRIPVISSGGIFTAADAREKFRKGASLIEVWTGFIYEGPGIVHKILRS